MNNIQMIVTGVFVFFIVVGIIVFAGFGAFESNGTGNVTVEVWGSIKAEEMQNVIDRLNRDNPGTINARYKEFPEDTLETELTEALAENRGPDVVLMPHDLLFKQQKKLLTIGYNLYSERLFKDSFIEGGEVFLNAKGILGFPFIVDPMVMYWNRDMFSSKAISRAPNSWEEVLGISAILTERSEDRTIKKSAISFGEYSNVKYAKDILATLMLQSGSHLVSRKAEYEATNHFGDNEGFVVSPIDTALSFYAQFADPLKQVYSWNRSLPDSEQSFLNGKLAMYLAPQSQAKVIRSKNPNLNFDMALMPQPKTGESKKTFGKIYFFGILANSKNQQAAYEVIKVLTSEKVVALASETMDFPPARRDLLSKLPGTSFGDISYQSAVWTKTWLDPDPKKTDGIFKTVIESIVSGRVRATEAAKMLSSLFDEIL